MYIYIYIHMYVTMYVYTLYIYIYIYIYITHRCTCHESQGPGHKTGSLIGKGGATISDLRKAAGLSIRPSIRGRAATSISIRGRAAPRSQTFGRPPANSISCSKTIQITILDTSYVSSSNPIYINIINSHTIIHTSYVSYYEWY